MKQYKVHILLNRPIVVAAKRKDAGARIYGLKLMMELLFNSFLAPVGARPPPEQECFTVICFFAGKYFLVIFRPAFF
jgi:hypothetical protein